MKVTLLNSMWQQRLMNIWDLKSSHMNKDGSFCKATDKVAHVFHEIWKNVDCLVSQSNSCHGYIAMLKTLLFRNEEAITSQKVNQLVTPGQMDRSFQTKQ